jgi:hypothetical protein
MGDWKGFERLAERIARDLLPHATIALDDRLPGRLSEKKRQIDVSIRWFDADQEYLTIVQARDRNKPANINAIGEFVAVIEDVGATRGVMVCRSGFTKNARTYARNKGIELYNLHAGGRAGPRRCRRGWQQAGGSRVCGCSRRRRPALRGRAPRTRWSQGPWSSAHHRGPRRPPTRA